MTIPGEKSGYDIARATYSELVSRPPVNPKYLDEALQDTIAEGEARVRAGEIGTVAYANEELARCQGALALNVAGLVKPPLSQEQVNGINAQIERLGIFTQENGNTGDGPTNTDEIPTAGRK